MALRIVPLFVCVMVVAGCRESATSPAPSPYTPEEQKAIEIAQAHVAKHGLKWGTPSQVKRLKPEESPDFKGDIVYSVGYPTPDDESRLLGKRSVLVDVATGRATTVMRE